MNYSSTRGLETSVDFEDVVLNGLAKDGGLYIPNNIPKFNKDEIESFKNQEYHDLVHTITYPFVSSNIKSEDYLKICKKTYERFSDDKIISLSKLEENEFILNLFHGPTFAFKDYALQLLGNIYEFILNKKKIKLTIIGATSGDTGSAAIEGCSKSEYVSMFILFPYKKVSEIQRRQMTTIDRHNVFNIAIKGDFDDCQNIIKSLFERNNKRKKFNLAAVNSINWVRIMGQIVYYFWAYSNSVNDFRTVNFTVPTGNFGNAFAGYFSKKMGLPISKIIVASNLNDVLTRFFETGIMKKNKTIKTLSPSMDIQVSSNFERLLFDFYSKERDLLKKLFIDFKNKSLFEIPENKLKKILSFFDGGRLDDNETKNTINEIYRNYEIIIDPHTAVGINIGRKKINKDETNFFLATAHYAKFINTVNLSNSKNNKLPKKLENILSKKEHFTILNSDVESVEDFILKKI